MEGLTGGGRKPRAEGDESVQEHNDEDAWTFTLQPVVLLPPANLWPLCFTGIVRQDNLEVSGLE